MNIIKKCLDELNKEEFRKDYVIGLLESYYEMIQSKAPESRPTFNQTPDTNKHHVEIRADETTEEIPAFLRTGPVIDTRS